MINHPDPVTLSTVDERALDLIEIKDDMWTPQEMVVEFATCMEQPLNKVWPTSLKLEDLRWNMIKEEYGEALSESCEGTNEEAMLKELADLVYVTYGYAATYGWDLDEAVRRVHKSNMSKLGNDDKPLKRPDGKVLKGPNYEACNLSDLVERKE
jgi:NTP pyrophosphatase (non-canonical NTP hydrolase)|tara:strand:- start:674 stop:1135 length:462 start_codon:yes stop_codon:yes gene_type:complete